MPFARCRRLFLALILVASFTLANAQKVKVGFDKNADFSKYHTYSWLKRDSTIQPTIRQMLVIMEVDKELQKKGLQMVESGGELIVAAIGGSGGEIGGEHQGFIAPSASASVYPYTGIWSGAPYAPGSLVVQGILLVDIADRASNQLVWQGAVSTKLDTDNRQKLAEHIRAAIAKLFERYPPK